jgi:hypothetical protein
MNERAPRKVTAPVRHNTDIFSHDARQMSLLADEPEPMPTMPRPGSQPDRLLRLLARGSRLTHLEILALTGSWRAAASAHELTLLGWQLDTRRIHAPTIQSPSRWVAEYALRPRHARLARGEQ